jgi:hypothetical protein
MVLIVRLKDSEGSTVRRLPRDGRPSREDLATLAAENERLVMACAERIQQSGRSLDESVKVDPIPNLKMLLVTCRPEASTRVRQSILDTCQNVASVTEDAAIALIP